jgi:hypothetical protein
MTPGDRSMAACIRTRVVWDGVLGQTECYSSLTRAQDESTAFKFKTQSLKFKGSPKQKSQKESADRGTCTRQLASPVSSRCRFTDAARSQSDGGVLGV